MSAYRDRDIEVLEAGLNALYEEEARTTPIDTVRFASTARDRHGLHRRRTRAAVGSVSALTVACVVALTTLVGLPSLSAGSGSADPAASSAEAPPSSRALPLNEGQATLNECLKSEGSGPKSAQPIPGDSSPTWRTDAVFRLTFAAQQAIFEGLADIETTSGVAAVPGDGTVDGMVMRLRTRPNRVVDFVIAHHPSGSRIGCGGAGHGGTVGPMPLQDADFVPSYAQTVSRTDTQAELAWGTYAEGVTRVTVTLGGKAVQATLSHGYFAAVGSYDPTLVGKPEPDPSELTSAVVTAYGADGHILSTTDQSEDQIVATHACWQRPDGTPLVLAANNKAFATVDQSPACRTALRRSA